MPLPRRRNTFPLWVPAGIFIFTLPSSVGTSMVAPSAACVKLIGTSQITSVSSRMKMGCSWTCTTTYRSPGGPPRSPGSPSPVSFSRVPVSTPGGTFTVRTLSCSTLPVPLHVWQGSVITFPVPWQWPQGRAIWKKPCVNRASPAGAAEDVAEDPFEDVVDVRAAESLLERARPESAGRLVSESIVARALLGVGKNLVGFGQLLEALLGLLVARVLVGVVLDREPAKRALQLLRGTGPLDPEHLVVVAFLMGLHLRR